MGFKMKSGNKVSFKNMGSSPAKQKERKNWENYGKGEGADVVKKSGLGPRETSGYTDLEDKTPGQLMEFDLGGIMKKYATKKRADKKVKTAYDTLKSKKKSPAKQKVDPDAPGTPGTPGYEPPVKRSDLDAKGKAIWDAHRAKKNKSIKLPSPGDKKAKNPDPNMKIKSKENKAVKLPSPAKGKGDNLKRIMAADKAAQKKAGTWYKPGAEPKVNKGSMPKNWNKGVTPGYESTKMAKDQKFKKNFDARQISKQKGKDFVKNLKTKGDLVSKKPSGNIAQAFKGVKKALKVGGKIAGGLGVAATLYDMYKSGQKHSGGKAVKGQKTGVVAPDPKKSIFKKKDRY